MCSPSVDCPFCADIESCPRVAAAFPTNAEEDAVKTACKSKAGREAYQRGSWFRQKPDVGGIKPCALCKTAPRVTGSYCQACASQRAAASYAENAVSILERKRNSYVSKKSAKRLVAG